MYIYAYICPYYILYISLYVCIYELAPEAVVLVYVHLQSWVCRAEVGIPSARLTATRIISPSKTSPQSVFMWTLLLQSAQHIISLSPLFALASSPSCAVRAVLYPHLALGLLLPAGPREQFPCEFWPPKDQHLFQEHKSQVLTGHCTHLNESGAPLEIV